MVQYTEICFTQYNSVNVYSFLVPNFIVKSLGFTLNERLKEIHPVKSDNLNNTTQ